MFADHAGSLRIQRPARTMYHHSLNRFKEFTSRIPGWIRKLSTDSPIYYIRIQKLVIILHKEYKVHMWQPALLVLNSVAMSLISAKKPIAEILKEILNLKRKDS